LERKVAEQSRHDILGHNGALLSAYLPPHCVPARVWARKKIDKIRRYFSGKARRTLMGGHYLIN
jgi:hypothetical protein